DLRSLLRARERDRVSAVPGLPLLPAAVPGLLLPVSAELLVRPAPTVVAEPLLGREHRVQHRLALERRVRARPRTCAPAVLGSVPRSVAPRFVGQPRPWRYDAGSRQ